MRQYNNNNNNIHIFNDNYQEYYTVWVDVRTRVPYQMTKRERERREWERQQYSTTHASTRHDDHDDDNNKKRKRKEIPLQ